MEMGEDERLLALVWRDMEGERATEGEREVLLLMYVHSENHMTRRMVGEREGE